jgi:hypothetical protein
MIRHTVLFEVKQDISKEELNSIFEELMLWKDTVKGIYFTRFEIAWCHQNTGI